MTDIISFKQALAKCETSPYILLGNGFSISMFPNLFSYKSLLEEANFDDHPQLKKVFPVLSTSDFERVIKCLKETSKVIPIYSTNDSKLAKQIKDDAEALKSILVSTITENHPEKISDVNSSHFEACCTFLGSFKKIYSLNYDLLLYWALLSQVDENPLKIDDGFRNSDPKYGADYRTFDSPHSPTFWYLHGGLHLFDAGSEVRKYIWSDTGKPLMEQVREALDNDMYPLFVAEGSSEAKMTQINHSGYLSKALRSFEGVCGVKNSDLFIYGHSLDSNDSHILDKIAKGKIKRIWISLFRSDEKSEYCEATIQKANALKTNRTARNPLEVSFFDANSAQIWGEE